MGLQPQKPGSRVQQTSLAEPRSLEEAERQEKHRTEFLAEECGEIEEDRAVGDGALDVAHDRALEIGALFSDEIDYPERQPLVAAGVDHEGGAGHGVDLAGFAPSMGLAVESRKPIDNFAGKFVFQNDSKNPNNTGYAYSNALLGAFQTYAESTNRSQYSPVTPILEFYVQDSWKVTPRLTFDMGVRFTDGLAQYMAYDYCSTFVPSRYDPAKAPLENRSSGK